MRSKLIQVLAIGVFFLDGGWANVFQPLIKIIPRVYRAAAP